jgi:hypothetical protein
MMETKEILRFVKERKHKLDSLEPLGNGVSLVKRGGTYVFKILEKW